MTMTRARMLEAFLTRNATMDGRFLTAVLTTGIYCRPSCAAKKPRPENVRFFETEAEARAEVWSADAYGAFEDATSVARAVGCGASKLNALFRAHYHTTPATFLLQARVAATCAALSRNGRNVLDAAYVAGFRSVSAFNVQFLELTGLRPTEYRALATKPRFTLRLPTDYRPEYTLRAQGRAGCVRTRRRPSRPALGAGARPRGR